MTCWAFTTSSEISVSISCRRFGSTAFKPLAVFAKASSSCEVISEPTWINGSFARCENESPNQTLRSRCRRQFNLPLVLGEEHRVALSSPAIFLMYFNPGEASRTQLTPVNEQHGNLHLHVPWQGGNFTCMARMPKHAQNQSCSPLGNIPNYIMSIVIRLQVKSLAASGKRSERRRQERCGRSEKYAHVTERKGAISWCEANQNGPKGSLTTVPLQAARAAILVLLRCFLASRATAVLFATLSDETEVGFELLLQ